MPKKQTTAAKKARAAARQGAKYTTALRQAQSIVLPAHLQPFEIEGLSQGERDIVDALRELVAAGGPLPVGFAEPDPEVAEAVARAAANGRNPGWKRWASVTATTSGYILRETQYGPNRSGYTKENRGPRVPVPVLTGDGTITVVAMPEWAVLHDDQFQWIWEHTGWPIDAPGRIVDPPQTFAPAAELRWQVAAWPDMAMDGGRVMGEDYGGSSGNWETVAWCTSRDDARQIAAAYTAHRGTYTRADVIEHGSDLGVTSMTVDTYLQALDAPERPKRATAPAGPRPASPAPGSEVPEPSWRGAAINHPPNTSLHVWTGDAWKTLAWTSWQSGHIADKLGVGSGGPYLWAESWGPRHPDKDMHDWTQEGRCLWGRYPDPTFEESTADGNAFRRGREDALVDALAERGGLTLDQAAARLAAGGADYRQVLDVGQAAIARALNTMRVELPGGPERTAVRHALDDLFDRHQVPADAERLANEQLDRELEKNRDPQVTDWCRRAVAEYLAPAPDPAAAGVDGFRPQEAGRRLRR